jgi:hypothetical protein
MKIKVWIKSVQPDWKGWSRFGSVSLKEAIYLSMDISPTWYQEIILDVVENYYGNSEYHRAVSDEEFNGIKEVYQEIEQEYEERMKICRSWFAQQDWAIEPTLASPNDIGEDTIVDPLKFMKFAFTTMKFDNEYDSIPNEIKGGESHSNLDEVKPTILSSIGWQDRAKLYAKEYMESNRNLSLAQLVDLVAERFSKEKIISAHAGGKKISQPTIKDALSKGGWFTQNQRKIAQ